MIEHPVKRRNNARMRRIRDHLAKEQGGLCFWCQCVMGPVKLRRGDGVRKETSLTLEHIIPLIIGGSNRIENLAAACYSCNVQRRQKQTEKMLKTLQAFQAEILTTENQNGSV